MLFYTLFGDFWKLNKCLRGKGRLAEREGFEPSIRFKGVYSLSRRAPSTYSAISPRYILKAPQRRQTANGASRSLQYGGGSRIRTHGRFRQRFSRPPPSTTRPSLRGEKHYHYRAVQSSDVFWLTPRQELFLRRVSLFFSVRPYRAAAPRERVWSRLAAGSFQPPPRRFSLRQGLNR